MTDLRLAMLGLGSVAQAFLRLLAQKSDDLAPHRISLKLVGVATRSRGIAANPAGLDLAQLLEIGAAGQPVDNLNNGRRFADSLEFVQNIQADVLLECITLNPASGQPAIDYISAALQRGLHVITANKSAPAFALARLSDLARRQKKAFLYEATVLDGTPVFSFVRDTLPATKILGFRGILNSTTNFVLTAMEEGLPPEDALRQAQALGIAEANPDYDLDGWDSAAKTAILVNALMSGSTTPDQIARTGIRHLTTRTVIEAARQGRRFKLLSEAVWRDNHPVARVLPRMVPLTNPLAHVSGTSAAITLITDTLGEVTLHLHEGEVPQTAYGLLADLITVIKSHYAK
ncbi:MAG: Homoserine dehydrogenase [Anaerolineae bacterium]|nr:Homoserine dehydrogenase [Anaerolineae bacterium]